MKKNKFMKDSFIATLGIVICKIVGLFYVIPFYNMLSASGGALYSYAYSIYTVFLTISTGGLPFAISKLVSEYNALECFNTKDRVYKIGVKIMSLIGIISFLIMFIFAKNFAIYILGDATGGNSIESVTTVIRAISTALLIVPIYSITKGYYQGSDMIKETSISNIIEQLVRVAIILISCYLIIKVLKLDEKIAVNISVGAATIGAIAAYLYLYIKGKKNKNLLNKEHTITRKESTYTNKYILKQILACAIPFILIDTLKSAFSMVDIFTLVKGLTNLGFDTTMAETVLSVISTWGSKISMIVISLAIGFSTSLIPNIASSYALKDYKSVNEKITQAITALFLLTFPATIGIFFLAKPIWTIFYGYDALCISVFKISIFTSISYSIYAIILSISQTIGKTKITLSFLLVSFLVNAFSNIPMINLCHKIGIPAYYGATISTLLTQSLASILLLMYLKKNLKFSLRKIVKTCLKITLSSIIMLLVLYITSHIITFNSTTKIMSIIEIIIFTIIGCSIYFICILKSGTIDDIFGENIIKKYINKFLEKKKICN